VPVFQHRCAQAPPASCSLRAGPFFAGRTKATDAGVLVAMTGTQEVAGATSSASATRSRLRTAAALSGQCGNWFYGKPGGIPVRGAAAVHLPELLTPPLGHVPVGRVIAQQDLDDLARVQLAQAAPAVVGRAFQRFEFAVSSCSKSPLPALASTSPPFPRTLPCSASGAPSRVQADRSFHFSTTLPVQSGFGVNPTS
jgi:hypothetical protein